MYFPQPIGKTNETSASAEERGSIPERKQKDTGESRRKQGNAEEKSKKQGNTGGNKALTRKEGQTM